MKSYVAMPSLLFPLLKRRAAPSFRSISAVAAESRFALSAGWSPGRPKLRKVICGCDKKVDFHFSSVTYRNSPEQRAF
jgi:hypothetical protein